MLAGRLIRPTSAIFYAGNCESEDENNEALLGHRMTRFTAVNRSTFDGQIHKELFFGIQEVLGESF